ncbi:MAG: ribbon-helix-helix domain-containing protein [Candidatus Dormibacteria bacterium]
MSSSPSRRPPSPARQRHEAAHPGVTFRCDRETYDRLSKLRADTGASFGELVRRALGGVEAELDTAIGQARVKGVEEGVALGHANLLKWQTAVAGRDATIAKWKAALTKARARVQKLESERVTFPCTDCGQPLGLVAGSPAAVDAIAHLQAYRWGHVTCPVARVQG